MRGNVTGNLVDGRPESHDRGHDRRQRHRRRRRLVARERSASAATSTASPTTSKSRPTRTSSGNAIAFGETVDVDGRVGIDLHGFGETVSVSGAVEGDVDGYAGTITLLPTARVGGNVTGHVDSAGDLERRVGRRRRRQRRRRSSSSASSAAIATRPSATTSAKSCGSAPCSWPACCCSRLFPVLREVSLPNALAVLRSGGIGLAAAVTLPVAAVLLCITIVGIPLGILTFVLGAIGLYFSKTVIAQIIGRAVFRDRAGSAALRRDVDRRPRHRHRRDQPAVRSAGIANFVLTLVGFGVIVSLLARALQPRAGLKAVRRPGAPRPAAERAAPTGAALR